MTFELDIQTLQPVRSRSRWQQRPDEDAVPEVDVLGHRDARPDDVEAAIESLDHALLAAVRWLPHNSGTVRAALEQQLVLRARASVGANIDADEVRWAGRLVERLEKLVDAAKAR